MLAEIPSWVFDLVVGAIVLIIGIAIGDRD